MIQIDHPSVIAGRMDVDHIQSVVAVEDSGKDKDWNKIIDRMFCEEENLQSICWLCHKSKSLAETTDRARARRENKK